VKKRLVVLICMIALAVALAAPATASASVTLTKLEKQIVTLVNKKRAARGLAKLRVNAKLVKASRSHSREMGNQQYFAHDSASGESFAGRLIRFGYTREGCSAWSAGENIAWGTGLYSTAQHTVNVWMKSAAHRKVMLTAKFRDLGIGAVVCKDGYSGCSNPVTFFTLDLGRRTF
jgi:uncharacterized protein YkwD